LLLLFGAVSAQTLSSFDDMLAKVPATANALAVVNVDAILKSPVAVREGWEKKQETQYQAATGTLPPGLRYAVLAAQLQTNPMRNAWEIGLGLSKSAFSVDQMAKRNQGAIDNIGGKQAIRTARNTYLVELAPRLVGMMFPANRQETSRWLKASAGNTRIVISDYLKAAAKNAESSPAIVMAIDAAEMIDPNLLKAYLSGVNLPGGKKVNPQELAGFLSSLRGLTFTIRFENTIQGEFKLDFDQPVKPYADILKPLILDTLNHVGLSFDELQDWPEKSTQKSFILASRMTEKEVRRLLTLIQPPMPSMEGTPVQGQGPIQGAADPRLVASRRYYQEIHQCLEDLREQQRKAKNHYQNAQWHEQYAKKIGDLPILNVDDELLKYGADMAANLRALAMSLNGVALSSNVMQDLKSGGMNVNFGSYYRGGYYGGYYGGGGYGTWKSPGSIEYYDNYQQIRTMQDAAVAKGIKDREEIWKSIAEDTQAIRQKMVAKYMVEF
jgi:hypothetical protein